MKIRVQEFQRMRDWFAYVSQRAFPAELIAKAQPIAHVDQLAERSPSKAREGLSMGINDVIEMTDNWSVQDVQATDAELAAKGLPTLTEMRVRFSKSVGRVIRRGRINDEVEYYAVRNAADLAQDGQGRLWKLLSDYEERSAS
jgi:hypothetical protein